MSHVYLVDDHAMVRDGLRAVLTAAGHQITGESADPTQALDAIQSLAPQIVLLDLNLGVHSGFELLTAMQKRQLPVRAIPVTMSAQPRHVAQALRLGAAGYILKGSPALELLQAIAVVMEGGRFLGRDVSPLAAHGLSAEADDADLLRQLSVREAQIIVRVARGGSSTQIGLQLHLSPKTVDSYRSRLMAKLGLRDVAALVRFAVRTDLVDAQEP
jgi:two-component system, NarL family, invasion response regulator UvrY